MLIVLLISFSNIECIVDEPSIAFIRAIAFLFNARQIALSDSKGELDGRSAMTSNLANVFENMKDGLKDKRQWLKPGQKIQFEQSQEYAKLLGQQRL